MIVYAQGDITKFDVDAIVNASNGFGYMGGKRCVKELHRGVAESIQFASQGAVKTIASLIKLGSECNIIKNIKKKIKAKIQLIITNISSSPY